MDAIAVGGYGGYQAIDAMAGTQEEKENMRVAYWCILVPSITSIASSICLATKNCEEVCQDFYAASLVVGICGGMAGVGIFLTDKKDTSNREINTGLFIACIFVPSLVLGIIGKSIY